MTKDTVSVTRVTIKEKDRTIALHAGRKHVGEATIPEGYDLEAMKGDIEALMEAGPIAAEEIGGWIEEYLENTTPDDGEDGDDAHDGGGVVPNKYKEKYGSDQNCGDDIALALTAHVKSQDEKGKSRVDFKALAKVQKDHSIDGSRYEHLNPGMQVMNTSNRLRGLYNKGGTIKIGGVTIKHPQADELKKVGDTKAVAKDAAKKKA